MIQVLDEMALRNPRPGWLLYTQMAVSAGRLSLCESALAHAMGFLIVAWNLVFVALARASTRPWIWVALAVLAIGLAVRVVHGAYSPAASASCTRLAPAVPLHTGSTPRDDE